MKLLLMSGEREIEAWEDVDNTRQAWDIIVRDLDRRNVEPFYYKTSILDRDLHIEYGSYFGFYILKGYKGSVLE